MAQTDVFAGQAEKPRQRNYIVFILDSSLTPLLSWKSGTQLTFPLILDKHLVLASRASL